jgi:hypothetical protein
VEFLFDKDGPKQEIDMAVAAVKQLDLSNFDLASVSFAISPLCLCFGCKWVVNVFLMHVSVVLLRCPRIVCLVSCIFIYAPATQQSVAEKATTSHADVDKSDVIKRVRDEYRSKTKVRNHTTVIFTYQFIFIILTNTQTTDSIDLHKASNPTDVDDDKGKPSNHLLLT